MYNNKNWIRSISQYDKLYDSELNIIFFQAYVW